MEVRAIQSEPTLMARISGSLYLGGVVFVVLSLQLRSPAEASELGLYAIAAIGAVGGSAAILLSRHVHAWGIHAMLALGSVLVCLCIYFSGVAAGVYETMFVWVVILSAFFFPGRPAAAHLAWLMTCFGFALGAVADPSGFATFTRWILTAIGLGIASAVTSWLVNEKIVAQRRLAEEVAARERLQRELEHLAHHDPLTGLANRRRLEAELDREIARSGRSGAPLCLIAIDLDGLKAVNDRLGHAGGDRLLKAAASAWQAELRAGDLLARLGGDEFVALLPDCEEAAAERVAARLRAATPSGHSCSLGIASWDELDTPVELLGAADRAMYAAKAGRSAAERSPD